MSANRLRLKPHDQQVMVITGATSGIGLALAREAAARGTAVFLIARNPHALEEVARELADKGARAAYHAADVGVESELRAAANEALQIFGGWDVWVNDAGVSIFGPIRETPHEDHRRLFDTNYWGVVHGSLVAVEHLRTRPGGGVLINVGSVFGDTAIPIQGAYAASKAAVKGFTEALRMELIRESVPVQVTLIKPSAVATPHKDHAKNLTESAIREPPPVYDARLVADAILYCTRNRVREMTVGFAGRALDIFHRLAPVVAEPLYARVLPALQRDRRAPRRRTEDSLYEAGYDLAERSDYGRVRKMSTFTQLQMHPLTAVGIALALGALAGAIRLAVAAPPARKPGARVLGGKPLLRTKRPLLKQPLLKQPLFKQPLLKQPLLKQPLISQPLANLQSKASQVSLQSKPPFVTASRRRPLIKLRRAAPAPVLPGVLAALATAVAGGAVLGVRRLRRHRLNGHRPIIGRPVRAKGWIELGR